VLLVFQEGVNLPEQLLGKLQQLRRRLLRKDEVERVLRLEEVEGKMERKTPGAKHWER